MAGTIKISSDLDARGFLKGTSNMEEALEDVSKELDKTGKDGVKDVDKLENKFSDAAKAAKDAGTDIRKGLGDGTKKGAKEAEAATEVYKKEAIANVSEVTSSFTGSWESAADAIQGTLGGVVADLGPIGAVAGAAGAIGIGLMTQGLIQAEEAAQKSKERVAELGQAMIDSGTEGEIPLEKVNERLADIITNSDEAVKKFLDIEKAVDKVGGSAEDLAVAYAGNEKALENQLEIIQDLIDEQNEQALNAVDNGARETTVQNEKIELLQAQQTELQGIQKEIQDAAAVEQAWLSAGGAEFQAKSEAIGIIDAAYDEAASSISDFKDEESGIIDVQAYIDSMAARQKALQDYQAAVAESGFSTEQKQALNDMGVEAAADFMAGYKQASPAQQKEMQTILTNMASESSGVAVKEMEKAFEKPVEAKVEAKVDMKMAQQDLDNLIKARTAVIKLDFRDRNGKKID
jgi:hypothetical protein